MNRLFIISIFSVLTAASTILLATSIQVMAQNSTNSTNSTITSNTNSSLQPQVLDNPQLELELDNATADTKWAKYFFENPGYENVTVVYESPNIIVLDSYDHELIGVLDSFWKAVDNVTSDGYNFAGIISDDQVVLTK
jgi:hypothetical protein